MLPWWFTAECRQQLLSVPAPPPPPPPVEDQRACTPDTRPPSSIGPMPMSQEQLRHRLRRQLEYYFSRENLINDRYLRCQMDSDQYVPISIVANFPKVTQLTHDMELILDVLRSSPQVQVDESGQKVRPVSKRCTIILREIPENADEQEVKSMFAGDGCPPYHSLHYGLNDSWYVTFGTEEDTQRAFFHLQTLGKTFNGKPVFARIKTGGAPIGADLHGTDAGSGGVGGLVQLEHRGGGTLRGHLIIHHREWADSSGGTPTPSPNPPCGETHLVAGDENVEPHGGSRGRSPEPARFELGQILAQCGYVPRATFRPLHPATPAPLQPAVVPQPTSYFAQPILHNVGQNEFVLRQRSRERTPSEVAASLIPSPVPRITDVPRLNGKGGAGSGGPAAKKMVRASSMARAAVDARRAAHSPATMRGGGGGGFVGFQRQESVEAYQMALAANGVGKSQEKQRRSRAATTAAERADRASDEGGGGDWEPVRKGGRHAQPQQHAKGIAERGGTNPSKLWSAPKQQPPPQQQPLRILGTASFNNNNTRFGHPVVDSGNWRQRTDQQPSSPAATGDQPHQQQPQLYFTAHYQMMARVQPLLSLPCSPLTNSAFPHQQQPLPPRGIIHCGSGRAGGRAPPPSYRDRTWTSDWAGRTTTVATTTPHSRQQQHFGGDEGRRVEERQRPLPQQRQQSPQRGEQGFCGGRGGKRFRPAEPQNGGGRPQRHRHDRHTFCWDEQRGGDNRGERPARRATHGGTTATTVAATPTATVGKQQQRANGYNFVEREFPALFGPVADQLHHTDQRPADQSDDPPPNGTSGTITNHLLPFSAIVAGQRRATIGGGGGRDEAVQGRGGGGGGGGHDEAQQQPRQHQRSGTVGAGGGGGGGRSYAQMLKKGGQPPAKNH